MHSINVFEINTGARHVLSPMLTVMMPGMKSVPTMVTLPPFGEMVLGFMEYTFG